jgi:hypothetical protein
MIIEDEGRRHNVKAEHEVIGSIVCYLEYTWRRRKNRDMERQGTNT